MKKWFILACAVAMLAILGCEKSGDSPEPSKNNNGDPPDTTITPKKDTLALIIEVDSTEISGYVITLLAANLQQEYPGFLPLNYDRQLKLGKTCIVFIGDTATHVLGKKLWITPGARGNLPGGTNLNLRFTPEFVTIEKMPKDTTLRFKVLPNR